MSDIDPLFAAQLRQLTADRSANKGRSVEELLQSNDPLKGAEAQRLREWFTSSSMDPASDLDAFGLLVFTGEIADIKDDVSGRVARIRPSVTTDEDAQRAVALELYQLRYGPTRVTIYGVILISLFVNPNGRLILLDLTRYLANEVKVPIDGTDASGTTVLVHAINTKPSFEPEFAQILHDAGANTNARNRYGVTAAHEIVLVFNISNREIVKRAADAMEWFLGHGGNIDVKDNDGMTARTVLESIRKRSRLTAGLGRLSLLEVVDREDERRKKAGDRVCNFCGREAEGAVKLLVCGRCKKARYCSLQRSCQKDDWPLHKSQCKKL